LADGTPGAVTPTRRRDRAPPEDTIRRALREAYKVEGDPFTTTAYMHWRAEQLGRWERERYPSYHTVWSRYGTWAAACADALGESAS
jgi:hypothetical protein